jgi:hypothetical protein
MTPPQLAKQWGCKPDKVLRLIRKGELKAFNLAVDPAGRPRYRLSSDAIREFERQRTVTPAPKRVRRYKQPKGDDYIEYF